MENRFVKVFIVFILVMFVFHFPAQSQESDKSYQFSYAVKLYTDGFTELASQQFSQFINRFPNDTQVPDAHFYLARCYEKLGQKDLAVIEYRKLALDYPGHEKARESWKQIGRLLKEEKKYAEAAKAFENLNVLYNGTDDAPEGLLLAGESFFLQKDYKNSSRVLNTLISRYPESKHVFEAELWLARLAMEDNNYPEAVEKLKKVVRGASGEDKYKAQIQLAEAFLGLNNVGSATEIIEALPLSAYNETFARIKVQLLWKQKKYRAAVQFITSLKSGLISNGILLEAYLRAGDYSRALMLMDKIDARDDPFFNLKKLIILVHLKRHQDIIHFISGWKNPEKDDGFMRIITRYLKELSRNGSDKELSGLLEVLQTIYPANDFAKNFTRFYCQSLWQNGQSEKLISYIRKNEAVIGTGPGADDALWYMGKAYASQKNYTEAANAYKKLIQSYIYSPYAERAVKELEFIQNYFLPSSAQNSRSLMDILASIINDRDNKIQLNLSLAKLAVDMYRDFPRALRYLNLARAEAAGENLAEIYEQLYYTYFSHYRVSGQAWSLDSARIYLKRYMQQETDKDQIARVSLHFFKYTISEILNSPARRKKVLNQLRSWRSGQNLQAKEVGELYYELIAADSVYKQLKSGNSLVALHPEKWILKAINVAMVKKDSAFIESKSLDILRRYKDRPAAFEAAKTLLNFYQSTQQPQKYSQIAGFISGNAWYNEIDINNEILIGEKLKNVNSGEIFKEFDKKRLLVPNDEVIMRELYPDFIELMYFTAKAYYIKGQSVEAQKLFNQFLSVSAAQNRHMNEIYRMVGDMALQERRFSDAVWYLSLYQFDGNANEFVGVGETIIRLEETRKHFEEVLKEAKLLIQILPKHDHRIKWEFHKINARLRIDKGKNFNLLITKFRKKYSKNKAAKGYIGKLYLTQIDVQRQNKNFKIVETLLKKGEKAADKSLKPDFLYWKGYIATIRNRDDEAMKYLSQFTEKYQSAKLLSKVYSTLGHLYYRSEKKQEALKAYIAALQAASSPDDIQLSLNNLIVLNKELGFWDAVLKYSQRFLREFPQDETVVDKQIWIGLSYSRLNRFDEAISHFKKIKPFIGADREPEAQFYIGEAYYNGGRYREAISEFLKIPLLSKKTKLQWEASALYFAGQAYERLGKKQEAIHMYQEIVKRPGILWELKKEAQKKISQLQ